MKLKKSDFLLDVWAFDAKGNKVHPYKGERGSKKGFFSVNFTNDTNNFEGMSEEELIDAITSGRFRERGTIRMLPVDFKPGAERNAFGPLFFKGKHVKDY
ncbi:hypothetical protein [Yersinia intermedia]|uniref:hypothetical protein n=1 Tax=Yersinia intermedia TaxID=631 RepID=UPI0039C60ABA|nr:hypothetical protein [Yersinia enterocolitica]EKN3831213.1 hypothetical protein [Yersinia enterocolitica]